MRPWARVGAGVYRNFHLSPLRLADAPARGRRRPVASKGAARLRLGFRFLPRFCRGAAAFVFPRFALGFLFMVC